MMGTFLDKAVEDESIAIYMSVMHEGTGDKDVTLAFEGSLTKGKRLKNIFPSGSNQDMGGFITDDDKGNEEKDG